MVLISSSANKPVFAITLVVRKIRITSILFIQATPTYCCKSLLKLLACDLSGILQLFQALKANLLYYFYVFFILDRMCSVGIAKLNSVLMFSF